MAGIEKIADHAPFTDRFVSSSSQRQHPDFLIHFLMGTTWSMLFLSVIVRIGTAAELSIG